jgi:hypothetical protein
MKVTVSFPRNNSQVMVEGEFDTPADALAFLDEVAGTLRPAVVHVNLPELGKTNPDVPLAEPVAAAVGPVKKLRKPRSDAGQPRGPYKTTTTGEPAASEPLSAAGDSVPAASAAPATPTKPAAPGNEQTQAATTVVPGAHPSPAAAELTVVDVRAAMEVLNKKRGIEANMKVLAQFKVQRASELPKEKYAEFIAATHKAAA